MKRGMMLVGLMLLSLVMFTGCEAELDFGGIIGGNDDKNYSVYEMHLYDDSFKHTEELVVKYDKDGNFKYMEYYMVYDSEKACGYKLQNWEKSVDAKYKDTKLSCETIDGKTTIKWSMTDKSVKDGYLIDEEDYDSALVFYYEFAKTEAELKEKLEGQITRYRDEGLFEADERNYFVIDGEKITE